MSLSLPLDHIRRVRQRDPNALPDAELWTLALHHANAERRRYAARREASAHVSPDEGHIVRP